jgi:hypothetical protein
MTRTSTTKPRVGPNSAANDDRIAVAPRPIVDAPAAVVQPMSDCLCSVRGSDRTGPGVVSTPTMRERIRYRVDRYMAKGGSSLFVSLLVVFFGLLLLIMLLRLVLLQFIPDDDHEHISFFETFLEMSDPGRLAEFNTSSRWFRLTAVLATAFGVIFFGALIAILTTSLDRRLAKLRRGHSRVLESGHTLILGWSPHRVVEVLKQLIVANESKRHAAIVILADESKEEMDAYLALHVKDRRTTSIITRSGYPADLTALDIVAANEARSAIVLSEVTSTAPEHRRDDADAQVIKVLLALSSRRKQRANQSTVPTPSGGTSKAKRAALSSRRKPTGDLNIVAEIMDPHLHHPARRIWPERITTLCPSDILAKILVETSRSVGLSAIYREILSFDGSELYFEQGAWGDAPFGSLGYRFEDGIPIGFQAPDHVIVDLPQNHDRVKGATILNPPATYPMSSGDELLILATDDSTIELHDEPVAMPGDVVGRTDRRPPSTERQLLVGWTAKSRSFIKEYADYVEAGSKIDVIVADETVDPTGELEELAPTLNGMEVEILRRDPTDPDTWASINPESYQNIVILADDEEEHAELIDAQTILILLLVRDRLPADKDGRHIPNIITELVGSENEELAREAGVHDFVVSPSFVSMLLAQISEEPRLYNVYRELFDTKGAEIYLKRASLYFDTLPSTVRFVDLMAVAQASDEVCLGVDLGVVGPPDDLRPGLLLDLDKNRSITIGPDDRLVVLAEDET